MTNALKPSEVGEKKGVYESVLPGLLQWQQSEETWCSGRPLKIPCYFYCVVAARSDSQQEEWMTGRPISHTRAIRNNLLNLAGSELRASYYFYYCFLIPLSCCP